jgi:hypothetical protein
LSEKTKEVKSSLMIGWASKNVTPSRPVLLRGQFYARVSEGVLDPITVTALALESHRDGSATERAVMVSCDFGAISDELFAAVRLQIKDLLPELDAQNVVINATHTHTAPENRLDKPNEPRVMAALPPLPGFACRELGVMEPGDYVAWAAERIAAAAAEAWCNREPGGIGFGLGQAVVGHNRRVSYYTGETRMYGKTDDPEFSHIEGGTDHSVNLLCTWNKERKLTGMIVNIACPSQTSEHLFQLSADYWHETRDELRRRFGADLFVLPQCGAAGDQSPHIQACKAAEERMWRLAGRTQRQDIAVRIADAVTAILPIIEKDIQWDPYFVHRVVEAHLPARRLEEQDVRNALSEADNMRRRYESLARDLEAHPEKRNVARWYKDITAAYSGILWNRRVEQRFQEQQRHSALPVTIHVLRLGDVAFAGNPFEYYLDFGLQIKARSKAVQTFLVQLVGGSGVASYLPTLRAVSGKSYGAVPASTAVGPEGGRLLANRTVEWINALWGE